MEKINVMNKLEVIREWNEYALNIGDYSNYFEWNMDEYLKNRFGTDVIKAAEWVARQYKWCERDRYFSIWDGDYFTVDEVYDVVTTFTTDEAYSEILSVTDEYTDPDFVNRLCYDIED